MATETLSAIGTLMGGVASVALAFAAWVGFTAWRNRDRAAGTQFAAARDALRAAVSVQWSFATARHPFLQPAEFTGRRRSDSESEVEGATRDEWYARSNRLQPLAEALEELRHAIVNCDVAYGEPMATQLMEAFSDLKKCFHALQFSQQSYFCERVRLDGLPASAAYPNRVEEFRHIVYSIGESDSFGDRVDMAVHTLEALLRKQLR